VRGVRLDDRDVGGLLRRLARLETRRRTSEFGVGHLAATLGHDAENQTESVVRLAPAIFAAAICLWGVLCDGHGSRAFPGTRDTLARSGDCDLNPRTSPRGKPRAHQVYAGHEGGQRFALGL